MKALGIIEVFSFTTAVCVADVASKAGGITMIAFDRNRPLSPTAPAPLVMAVKFTGTTSDVKAAVEAGSEYAKSKGKFIVSHVIANPGPDVEKMAYLLDINRDGSNKKLPRKFSFLGRENDFVVPSRAIGLLEVQGLVASIEGADTMLKTSDIRIVHVERRLGGRLCTFVITGQVSAVTAALKAGQAHAEKLGEIFGCEVISNLHEEVTKFFDFSDEEGEAK